MPSAIAAHFGVLGVEAPDVLVADAVVGAQAAEGEADDGVFGEDDGLDLFEAAGRGFGAFRDEGHVGMVAPDFRGDDAAQPGFGFVLERQGVVRPAAWWRRKVRTGACLASRRSCLPLVRMFQRRNCPCVLLFSSSPGGMFRSRALLRNSRPWVYPGDPEDYPQRRSELDSVGPPASAAFSDDGPAPPSRCYGATREGAGPTLRGRNGCVSPIWGCS